MNVPRKLLAGLLVGSLGVYALWLVVRAQYDLVSVKAQQADVRQVIRKLEWQTWETILVDTSVQGTVTLNVRRVPLEAVLQMIADQTSSHWNAVYPVYSDRASLTAFERSLRGEIDPAAHGWSRLADRASFRSRLHQGAPFGGAEEASSGRVSLRLRNKDLPSAALALSRFTDGTVLFEDGTVGRVNLALNQASVSQAVTQLARKANRNWTRLYALWSDAAAAAGEPPEDELLKGPAPEPSGSRQVAPESHKPPQIQAPKVLPRVGFGHLATRKCFCETLPTLSMHQPNHRAFLPAPVFAPAKLLGHSGQRRA